MICPECMGVLPKDSVEAIRHFWEDHGYTIEQAAQILCHMTAEEVRELVRMPRAS